MIKHFTYRAGVMLALALATLSLQAQTKLGVDLVQKLQEVKKIQKRQGASQDRPTIQVFVAGDAQDITASVEQLGGTVLISTSNILSVEIPADKIGELAGSSSVLRIESAQPYTMLNDESRKHMGVDKVQNGQLSNGIKYQGEGVIVGIIDSGIDYRHPDFCNPTDKTKSRILYLWDQKTTGTSPGVNYGKEYTQEQINKNIAGTASDITHKDLSGHGTHVAGTAAGNGAATGKYGGMAPKADLIIVGLNFSKSGGVEDAANYIFKKAEELHKPCVINLSLGSHIGPHDGTSLREQILSNLVTEKPGRAIVAAAGNENGAGIHWGNFNLTAEPQWHYRAIDPTPALSGETVDAQMYGLVDNADPTKVSLSIGADSLILTGKDITGAAKQSQTPWFSIDEISKMNGQGWEGTLSYKNKDIAEVTIYTGQKSETQLEFLIIINDIVAVNGDNIYGQNIFSINVKGEGKIHFWANDTQTVEQGSPITTATDYRFPDNKYIVGSPASANEVIAVGAFANMKYFKNKAGSNVGYNSMTVGEIAEFSSIGPTVDGRVKPEITAPGHNVVSVLSKDCSADETGIAWGGKHQTMSGTSMACPNVTGCIALYLQKNPTATIAEIRKAVTTNAKSDVNTGNALPNNTWGYGKIDIFTMMQSSTGVETTSANDPFNVKCYPNPFGESATIEFYTEKPEYITISLYTLSGQLAKTINTNNLSTQGKNTASIEAGSLTNGVYFMTISNGSAKSTTKLVVAK